MKYLNRYLERIEERGNHDLALSVKQTAEGIYKRHLADFDFQNSKIGLLFGNIQSGKTSQMFGILSRAADDGFPVFLILTTDNISLQQQTLDRVKSDLPDFLIFGENDGKRFADCMLTEPAIVVLKKNARILKQWSNIFKSTDFLKGNPLFIFDDEADAASLNTGINQNQVSSINRYLKMIREDSLASIYLQVTGTPQAILLQNLASGWKPMFAESFKPGKGYLGGNFFFPETGKPACIEFISDELTGLKKAVIHHIACSAVLLDGEKNVCNALFHPGVRVSQHEKTATIIKEILTELEKSSVDELESIFKREYSSLDPQKTTLPDFEEYFEKCRKILIGREISLIVMNGKNMIENIEYQIGSNIIVGGNTLGRGVTFPGLHTIYYTRTAKNPQADTMWQHSRMFGYDRDTGLVRVYIDPVLYKLFSDINKANNTLMELMSDSKTEIAFCYPEGLKPTRKNVIDQEKLNILTGGTNYFASNPKNNTFKNLDMMLDGFDDKEESYQISIRLMMKILSQIDIGSDFPGKAVNNVFESLLADSPAGQGRIIIRRNRKVTQGTGALLSPNDLNTGIKFKDVPVLTLYRVEGKGWNSNPIWVPNIKLPHGLIYIQSE